ncbi:MAG: hypothetical protein JWR24_2627 [Actinoallomurus sp.]|nr:hypothetical protein [Actinoallomurus sp.]
MCRMPGEASAAGAHFAISGHSTITACRAFGRTGRMPAMGLFDVGLRKSTQSDAGQGCVEVAIVTARSGKLIERPQPPTERNA